MNKTYFDTLPNDMLHYIAAFNQPVIFIPEDQKFLTINIQNATFKIRILHFTNLQIEEENRSSIEYRWGMEMGTYKKKKKDLEDQIVFMNSLKDGKECQCCFDKTLFMVNDKTIKIATPDLLIEIPVSKDSIKSLFSSLNHIISQKT